MADNIADAYNAGGMSYTSSGMNPSEGIGRWWNNITGQTANNMLNIQEAEKARSFNSAEAQKQRDWEEFMSNTAYQRGVADMKAAGINPMVIAGAAQASTPSGNSATSPAAHASASGSAGIFGLISQAANIAIAKGLEAKFTNSAMKAADNHDLVTAKIRHLAAQEKSMNAMDAYRNAKLEMNDKHFQQNMDKKIADFIDTDARKREEDAARFGFRWKFRDMFKGPKD